MAVHAFFYNGQALKVGKVGPKSAARYTAQHYSTGSSKSNLAQLILKYPSKLGDVSVEPSAMGDWIQQSTDRVNLLLPFKLGMPVFSLLEAFLHARWKPLNEGRSGVE